MYKTIIVDDEATERKLLAEIIGMITDKFDILTFATASEALTYIENNHVDVVFTDIKMPQMSGLELIEKISLSDSKIRTVIITGHMDFEYVRAAIKFGTMQYLLKPISVDELKEIIDKIIVLLDDENVNAMTNEVYEEFFTDLCICAISEEELPVRFRSLSLPQSFLDKRCMVVKIKIMSNNHHTNNEISNALNAVLANFCGKYTYYFYTRRNVHFFFVLNAEDFDLGLTEEKINNLFDVDAKLEIISVFENVYDVNCNIFSESEKTEIFISHIILNDKDISKKLVKSIMDNINSNKNNELDSHYLKILKKANIDDIKEFVAKARTITDESDIIAQVEKYVSDNYQNFITREDVAKSVYMNPSYFSRYFKKRMGVGFYDYLLDFRLNKAMELLATDMNIEKIASMVGFGNTKTFRRLLKQKTSMTPREYRLNLSDK